MNRKMTDQTQDMDAYDPNNPNYIDTIEKLNKLDSEHRKLVIACARECCTIENFNRIKKRNEVLENFIVELQKSMEKLTELNEPIFFAPFLLQ
jgi:hypothetical protein